MKFCAYCGKELQEEARFCEACGRPCTEPEADCAQEQAFLDTTYRFLKYERLAYKIYGIVMLVLVGLIVTVGLVLCIGALSMLHAPDVEKFLAGFVAFWYLFLGLLLLPVPIINLCAVKKVEGYMNTLYTDIRPAAARCGGVGMIVFNAFFNEIALIFTIINFVRMKANKQLVAQIAARQGV